MRRTVLLLASTALLVLLASGMALAAAGELDSGFGAGGKVISPSAGGASGVVLQPDNKILVAGLGPGVDGSQDFVLVRYMPNGSLDTSFGNGGKVTTDFAEGDLSSSELATSLALQPDGKIVVVGITSETSNYNSTDFALARYHSDGSLDTSFGANGLVKTSFSTTDQYGSTIFASASASSVAVLSDGTIVAAGHAGRSDSGYDFALAKYHSDGSLDTTFGTDGKVRTPAPTGGGLGDAADLAVQPDNKLIVINAFGGFTMVRYNPNGTLDPSFGVDGRTNTTTFAANASAYAQALDISPDGKIVAVGYTSPNYSVSGTRDFAVARYKNNGDLDVTFDDDGKATTDFGNSTRDEAYDAAIQPDNKVLVVGNSEGNFGLVRYNADGGLDTAFGDYGKATTAFGFTGGAYANSVSLQPDGKAVVVGSYDSIAMARYMGDPDVTPPTTTLNAGPSGYVRSTSASFSFSSEAGATFECSLDGAAFAPCSSPKSYTVANGSHTFSVRATDAAGNVDASPAIRAWTVDTTPPPPPADTIKPTVSGMSPANASTTRDTTPTIKAVVRDNRTNLQKANIKLYVAGRFIYPTKWSYNASTDLLTYSPKLPKGKKTVKVVATDAARNVGARSWYFTIR